MDWTALAQLAGVLAQQCQTAAAAHQLLRCTRARRQVLGSGASGCLVGILSFLPQLRLIRATEVSRSFSAGARFHHLWHSLDFMARVAGSNHVAVVQSEIR